jgi:hypothetical protein
VRGVIEDVEMLGLLAPNPGEREREEAAGDTARRFRAVE